MYNASLSQSRRPNTSQQYQVQQSIIQSQPYTYGSSYVFNPNQRLMSRFYQPDQRPLIQSLSRQKFQNSFFQSQSNNPLSRSVRSISQSNDSLMIQLINQAKQNSFYKEWLNNFLIGKKMLSHGTTFDQFLELRTRMHKRNDIVYMIDFVIFKFNNTDQLVIYYSIDDSSFKIFYKDSSYLIKKNTNSDNYEASLTVSEYISFNSENYKIFLVTDNGINKKELLFVENKGYTFEIRK